MTVDCVLDKMAVLVNTLNLALLIIGFLSRLTPSDIPETILRRERPENLGYYASTVITNIGNNNYAIEKLFPTNVNTIENGHPMKTISVDRRVKNQTNAILFLYILLSGDVHQNPGPLKFPCINCRKPVKSNQRGIQCDFCDLWVHLKCSPLTIQQYDKLSTSDDEYFCENCNDRLPNFSDSYFEFLVDDQSNAPLDINTSGVNKNIFQQLRDSRSKHPGNFIAAYININSLRYKFNEIQELLDDKVVDLLYIAETKLDETFNDSLFIVEGYKLFRRDRTRSGGGILALINSDIPSSRQPHFESKDLENICIEVHVNDRKWLVMGVYKPPSVSDNFFTDKFSNNLDQCLVKYGNYLILGDLNFDLLHETKCKTLNDICEIFDLSQLVKDPTCFMKNCKPSLVDVVLTNNSSLCFNTHNIPTGISDCHNLISTTIKGNLPGEQRKPVSYRSYRNFDLEVFNHDIGKINIPDLTNVTTEQQVNDAYMSYEHQVINTLNKHAPIKSRTHRKKPLPCMNGELRKEIYRKHMLYTNYTKQRNSKTWDKYRKQRNFVNKLKKDSMKTYFLERCRGGANLVISGNV